MLVRKKSIKYILKWISELKQTFTKYCFKTYNNNHSLFLGSLASVTEYELKVKNGVHIEPDFLRAVNEYASKEMKIVNMH